MVKDSQLLPIDDHLRLVLFGLECALNVEFSPDIVECIFCDSEHDARQEKRYLLSAGPHLKVTGYMEEYEPEEIWLTVESDKAYAALLSAIFERAKSQVYRLAKRPRR